MSEQLPSVDEAMAYADGYVEALEAKENADVGALIIERDALQGRLVFANAKLATVTAKRDAARKIITKAQEILAREIEPDGISLDTAINELLGLLDGPKARAALGDGGGNG